MQKKDIKKACLSSILLFSLIAGILQTDVVLGNPIWDYSTPRPLMIYIRQDGTIDPPTVSIQQNGTTYTFTDNILNASLIIETDNIEIDGAGYLLQGTGPSFDPLNEFNGILLTNRKNVTIKNTIIKEYDLGIKIESSSQIDIIENQIFEKIYLYNSSSNCQIIKNNLSIVEVYSSLNTIAKNNFTLPHCSLSIQGNNSVVSENFFYQGYIMVGPNSHYNSVSKNNLTKKDGPGILLGWASSNNEVFENEVSFKEIGLEIISSFENIIFNNTVSNSHFGIKLSDSDSSFGFFNTIDNLIYCNNFLENFNDVHIQSYFVDSEVGFNVWDNGEEGNYYGNYNGTDANGDGFIDIPYVINVNNQDRFPLMLPFGTNDYTNEYLQPESFPTTLAVVSIVVIIIIGLSILVYSKKFRRNKL